jgi:hypothetical protein
MACSNWNTSILPVFLLHHGPGPANGSSEPVLAMWLAISFFQFPCAVYSASFWLRTEDDVAGSRFICGRYSFQILAKTLAILLSFRSCLQSLKENAGIIPWLGYNCSLWNPYQFIIHISSKHKKFVSPHYPLSCFCLKIQRFGDWILSPSSGGTYSVGPNR